MIVELIRSSSQEAMELHGGVVRCIFHPSRHAESASPAVSMMSGTTAVVGTKGMQLMSHFNRAKKKLKLINKMFLIVSSEKKGEEGIFLKSGDKPPVGWV
ncbi:hypothetical protein [Pseudomonas fluorescens]|uniref:hypothetical protein n=1 Tax=Pseudomonas fluorescens TaxID=294 RepID=UPI001242DC72|nr:hypothetical protein [Pseudomonas fluorescens]